MAVSSCVRRLAAANIVKTVLLGASSAVAASVMTTMVMSERVMAEGTEDVSERNTIVVTGVREKGTGSGTKTDTPLMETPQTITVIDADELARRNARSLNQALTYVAGISPNQRGAMVTRYDQMFVRGFTPGLYLDGMRLIAGPYSTPQIDFNRIDHIDVVKGPASVLYGNSTPGGLINLTSKLPEPTALQRVELAAGNYDTQRADIDINRPLDEDGRWLFRLVSGVQRSDGSTAMTESERTHFSPMITYAPSAATNLTLIGAYQHDPKSGGYSGVPAFGSVLPSPLGDLPRDINTGDPNYEVFDRYQRSLAALFRHDFNDRIALRANARFHNTELSYRQLYVAGFATTGTGAARNTDYSTIIRGGGGADEDFDTVTADTGLTIEFGTGSLAHHVLTGVDYQSVDGENFQHFNTGETANPLTSVPNLSLFAPTYRGVMPTRDLTQLSSAYTNNDTEREQIGVYLQDQITIQRLQLIASGRYDTYDQDTLNERNGTTAPLSQHAFTSRLGALYELPGGFAPYVSYSESFEPQAGTTYQGDAFDPVTGRQYELGVKYQPQNTSAIFMLAGYDLRRQDVPVAHPNAGTGGVPANAQVQIGEVMVRGAELEGRGELLPGWDLVLTGTYMDAEIARGSPASGVTPATTGTRPLGVPDWMASTFVSYDFAAKRTAGPLGGLTLGAGVRYVGGSDGTTTYAVVNGRSIFTQFTTDSFVLVDALASYDLGRWISSLSGAHLALNVANLFDERHVTACPFSNSCYFGASRTVVGTVRYEW
jgi:iron complex outermembrane recepter protein